MDGMSLEPPSSPNSSCRKRKRSTESDFSFATSLTALSHFSFDQQPPLTPVSSWSALSNLKNEQSTLSNDEASLPTRHSSLSEDQVAKRQFMSPRRRNVSVFPARIVPTPPGGSFEQTLQTREEAASQRQCHVCNNSMTAVADSSYFLWPDCGTCHKVTCYVCLRKCQGPCHQEEVGPFAPDVTGYSTRDVCASCCVEVGYEGIVWCNACYTHDDNDDQRGRFTVGKNKKEMQCERIGMVADWLSHCSD